MVLAYYPQRSRQSLESNSNFPPQGGELPIGAAGTLMKYEDSDIMAYQPASWFNALFQQRIPLTINAGQVPTPQFDFTLLINDTFPDLIGEIEAELRFAAAELIQLEYDIEKFDDLTGELIAWVKKPLVRDFNVISIYFDNPEAVDEQNPEAVWSDYNAVYHMNQTTFGASSTLDSTSNNLHGTPQSMDITNQVQGQIDGSLDFDGSNEFVVGPASSLLEPGAGAFVVFAWVRPDANSRNYIAANQAPGSPNNGWFFNMSNTGSDRNLSIQMKDNGLLKVRGTIQLTLGVLHYVGFTYDGSGDASGVRIFVDGVEDIVNIESDTLVGGVTSPGIEFNIGNIGGNSPGVLSWNGIIDEVNISSVVKTPDFITTSFNNQDNPGAFYSTGAVESVPAPSVIMRYEE